MGSSVEVDELSWRCRKRSPFHKTSAWIFCAGSNRQVAHPSHLMGSQLGFFVRVNPALATPGEIHVTTGKKISVLGT